MAQRGRSLLKGEISIEEIQAILSSSSALDPKIINYYLKDAKESKYDTYVWEGDLCFDGDWDPFSTNVCNLIVLGNLEVQGLMTFYNDPATFIFVKGNLDVENLVAGDTLEVCGTLNAKNAVLCTESEAFCIHGDLNAAIFLPADADVTISGQKHVQKAWIYPHRIADKTAFPYITNRELFLLLRNEAFDEPIDLKEALSVSDEEYNYFDYVNFRGIIQMLVKRESIYRNE